MINADPHITYQSYENGCEPRTLWGHLLEQPTDSTNTSEKRQRWVLWSYVVTQR